MENNVNVWLIADTHFGYKGDDEEWLDDYIGYFKNEVIPVMRREVGPNDILVHCGDVFDNRSTIGIKTLCDTISVFEDFSNIFNDIRIVVGNHDMAKKSSNVITSVNVLKHIPHIKIYYKPEVETICGKTILFNPWIEDVSLEKNELDKVSVDYIFGHLQIGGSKTCDRCGVKIVINEGIKMSDFKNAQVYAGHIHIRQDNKNVHYVGNPYHKDRGDRDNIKGITVLDIKSGDTRFIENKVTPKYINESIYDILNMTIGELKSRWKNNRIDLHIKNSDYGRCSFDELMECLNTYFRDFKPVGDDDGVELKTEGEVTYSDVKSSDDYMDDFIKSQDLEPKMEETVYKWLEDLKDRL